MKKPSKQCQFSSDNQAAGAIRNRVHAVGQAMTTALYKTHELAERPPGAPNRKREPGTMGMGLLLLCLAHYGQPASAACLKQAYGGLLWRRRNQEQHLEKLRVFKLIEVADPKANQADPEYKMTDLGTKIANEALLPVYMS